MCTGETAAPPGQRKRFPGVPGAFEEGHGYGCGCGCGGRWGCQEVDVNAKESRDSRLQIHELRF